MEKAMTIEKVCVIGSGVMGSGIAAQIANAGIPVILLDIVAKDNEDRSFLAKNAIKKMLKTDPAPFMHKKNAGLITPGNLEDDLELIKDCDWIIEVVLEDLDIKHQTYKKINEYRKKGSVVSSNTSTIPLKNLVDGFDNAFQEDFLITHFFNPPRYMRLLEIVVGEKTRDTALDDIRTFCDVSLGKGVVFCNDTPGFIANRLGVFWLTAGVNEAINQSISVQEADLVMSRPVGIPKTGVFGLIDLVGIDLMPHLSKSLLSTLPENDAYRKEFVDHPFIHEMIKEGYIGRKGKGGFYRLDPNAKGKRVKQALSLDSKKFSEDSFVEAKKTKMASVDAGKKGLRAVVETDDKGGRYAMAVLLKTLHYAASLVPEIADNIYAVDEAMKLGYNWKKGPFEMIDSLGAAWFSEKIKETGHEVPALLEQLGDGSFYKIENGKNYYFGTDGKYHEIVRSEGVLLLRDIKLTKEPLFKTASASLWDVDDGILCVEFTGKMNTMDEQVFEVYHKAISLIEDNKEYKGLVIYNEGSAFSAGANLGLAMFAMNIGLWPQIDSLIAGGQKVYMELKYASFPVVAAPSGLALGGGCEILLHADHVQAHAETYTGLVEVGVGLIPGWGGCKEMVLRFLAEEQDNYDKATGGRRLWFSPKNSPMGAVRKAFETIGLAKVAKSAQEAKSLKYFKESDGITMNRDRLLFDAKQKALELAKDYQAPEKIEEIRLPGPTGKLALDMAVADMRKSGKATDYDVVVSSHLASVLSGGDKADWTAPISEEDLLSLELKEFKALVKKEGTMQRVEHMLNTGKPLRN
jgi:3-hydroxyacyl-CoA dehydrogenase